MNRNIARQWVTMVAIWASFSANILANLIPLNGLSIGAISNQLFGDVLITPENYAFSVWGIIFLGLISLAFFQARSSQRHNPQLQQIGFLLVASSLAQIAWVIVFLMRWFNLSLVAMIAILLPLMEAYRRLQVAKQRVPSQQQISSQQRWFVHIPISLYLSWLALATILNVAIALTALGWSGSGISPVLWTGITMVLAAGVAAIAAIAHKDIAYVAVFAWGLVAIAVRQWEIPELAFTALGLVAIDIAVLFVSLGHCWKSRKPSSGNV